MTYNFRTIAKENKFVSHPLYRMLGFFSIIATMRLQCLIGDFQSVLKTVAPIDLFTKSRSAQVTACHVTLYYHVGFAYMVLRRFIDAIKTFSNILVYINRTKQFHTKSSQFEQLMKKNDQIYSLLAICVAVCPTGQRVDDNIHTVLKDKYADKMIKMQKG
jgi:translation initiation factor 3 subunit L